MTSSQFEKLEKLSALRSKHPVLRYEGYAITPANDGLTIEYSFHLSPNITFRPTITIPSISTELDSTAKRLVFLIGMVELLSYWKLACPPRIEVAAGHLTAQELNFWENLIRNGLGEFFYVNGISPSIDLEIAVCANRVAHDSASATPAAATDSCMVLVGGGKDSIVTLTLLKRHAERFGALSGFAINPIPASLKAIEIAGYPDPLIATRRLDPQIAALNAQGYLNGHTPFSALLAFVSVLVAYKNGIANVLASNESSASEGNVEFEGFSINHQYSKSFEFEANFGSYMQSLGVPVRYASLLRPLNELQICALFSTIPEQHPIFRSCNRAQTQRARQDAASAPLVDSLGRRLGWCAECPKCIFTYLCLSCFLKQGAIREIFGVDPTASSSFTLTARELAGFSVHKPFECVGTFEEVQATIAHLFSLGVLQPTQGDDMQRLHQELHKTSHRQVSELLRAWDQNHLLEKRFVSILDEELIAARRVL